MTGLGHNGGPTLEAGGAWRRHCWKKARRDLLPRMPLEVVRIRMRRARELGLAFPAYNRIRQTTGRDILAFLFSSNALRVHRPTDPLPAPQVAKLIAQRGCGRVIAAHPPLQPGALRATLEAQDITVSATLQAPGLGASFSETRARLQAAFGPAKLPGDGVVLVAETMLEKEWVAAGNLGGMVTAGEFFGDL